MQTKPKKGKADVPAKQQKVNTMSLKSSKCEFVFALVGEAVHIVFKKGKLTEKVVITAVQWMEINKGMFNPDAKVMPLTKSSEAVN